MKFRIFAITVALVAGSMVANAQTAKEGKNVFVGVGAGVISVNSNGFGDVSPYFNIEVGKYINHVWGVRGVIGGPFQTLNESDKNAFLQGNTGPHYSKKNKLFGELNADIMFSLSNAIKGDLAKVDLYAFVGPTLNLSSVGTDWAGLAFPDMAVVKEVDGMKLRAGATAGLGLSVGITPAFALGVEGRYGVTPSIFGAADACRKAEGTGRLALRATWTIGGRTGKHACNYDGYLTEAEAQARVNEALSKVKPVEKIVEKIVEKEVVKVETVASDMGVFFKINSAKLSKEAKVQIHLFANAIKAATKDAVYEVAGYADKATGSVATNQRLSEQRAKAVYDALIAEGVPAKQLTTSANGGVDAMFFNDNVLSRCVVARVK